MILKSGSKQTNFDRNCMGPGRPGAHSGKLSWLERDKTKISLRLRKAGRM